MVKFCQTIYYCTFCLNQLIYLTITFLLNYVHKIHNIHNFVIEPYIAGHTTYNFVIEICIIRYIAHIILLLNYIL